MMRGNPGANADPNAQNQPNCCQQMPPSTKYLMLTSLVAAILAFHGKKSAPVEERISHPACSGVLRNPDSAAAED